MLLRAMNSREHVREAALGIDRRRGPEGALAAVSVRSIVVWTEASFT